MRTILGVAGLCLLSVLGACGIDVRPASEVNEAVLQEEREAAFELLSSLQAVSFAKNREFCGALMRRPDGVLIRSEHFEGRLDGCTVSFFPEGAELVAIYHTHGADVPGFDNEVPSVLDLKSEMSFRIDGYVSTPGGRFWHTDGRRGIVTLVCGPGCLQQDPNYRRDAVSNNNIKRRYTLQDLIARRDARILPGYGARLPQ